MIWIDRLARQLFFLVVCLGLIASSCQNETRRNPPPSKDELIERNKQRLSREDDFIDAWLARTDWKMLTSPTGLRYFIYSDSIGDPAKSEDIARVSYRMYLLDSTLVENFEDANLKSIRIDHDEVVSGLHEALKLLSPGDSAIVLLPSYLAYGLTGDVNIPPNMPLIYDIYLVDKR